MKKLLSLILVIALMFVVTGCQEVKESEEYKDLYNLYQATASKRDSQLEQILDLDARILELSDVNFELVDKIAELEGIVAQLEVDNQLSVDEIALLSDTIDTMFTQEELEAYAEQYAIDNPVIEEVIKYKTRTRTVTETVYVDKDMGEYTDEQYLELQGLYEAELSKVEDLQGQITDLDVTIAELQEDLEEEIATSSGLTADIVSKQAEIEALTLERDSLIEDLEFLGEIVDYGVVYVDTSEELEFALSTDMASIVFVAEGEYYINPLTISGDKYVEGETENVVIYSAVDTYNGALITIQDETEVYLYNLILSVSDEVNEIVYVDNSSLVVDYCAFVGTGVANSPSNYGATQVRANNGSTLEVFDSSFIDFARVGVYARAGSSASITNNYFESVLKTDEELKYAIMGYWGANVFVSENEFYLSIAEGVTPRDDWSSSVVSLGGVYEINSHANASLYPMSTGYIGGNTYTGDLIPSISYLIYGDVVVEDTDVVIYQEGTVSDEMYYLTVQEILDYGLTTLYVDGVWTYDVSTLPEGVEVVLLEGGEIVVPTV